MKVWYICFYNTINNLDTNPWKQYLKILSKQEILHFNNIICALKD